MITESLLNKEGVADGIGHRPENSPQITILFDVMEHLLETEGATLWVLPGAPKVGGEERIRDRAAWARESWGQVLGTGKAQVGRNGRWLRTWFASSAF
jgi:hypothetical protein